MDSFEKPDLGDYRGDAYFLVGVVEPKPKEGEDYDPDTDADNYGVAVVRDGEGPLEENQQVVRIDTCHDRPHMDLVYLPADSDQDSKRWLDEDRSYEWMRDYLLANWTQFADLYIKHNE